MRVTIYSTHDFEKDTLIAANNNRHELKLVKSSLNIDTTALASRSEAVCIFVNDDASPPVLEKLYEIGVRSILLRSAGFNNVDVNKAKQLGIRIGRVPAYSPHAVAEHAVALMLALNRKLVRANNRVHELNFSLNGLTGFDMNGKTVGIVGTGKIGAVVAKIMYGFSCLILVCDQIENEDLKNKYGVKYTTPEEIYEKSDIITLHVPLLPETRYLINEKSIGMMKTGVMLINTSRGGLVNTKDVIKGLKKGKIGFLGLDVYEEESKLFFEDHSEDILQDDMIARLLTFKNVLITSHQGFLTHTALKNIADTTLHNIDCFVNGTPCENEI